MRRPVIAGNWKLFKTQAQTREFFSDLVPSIAGVDHCDVIVAPPFTSLPAAIETTRGSNVAISAQDVYWEDEGAFTGEISAPLVAELGCEYSIIGHSERRQYFGETDETVSRKIGAVLKAGLKAIVCLGETFEDREAGEAETIVQKQLTGGLAELTGTDLSNIIVAYEPVWAIGTGRTATPKSAQSMHHVIREGISTIFGSDEADKIRILYGGSVKPDNVAELMAQTDIDGGLVGGASLNTESFEAIIRYPSR